MNLKARRKFWLEIHLWLGLALGLFLSIFGITGSILVFYPEIEELLNPGMLVVAQPLDAHAYRPLSEIFKSGSAVMPPQAKHTFATYPRNSEAAFILRYALPLASGVTEQWQVAVNPYTAEVTGKQLGVASDSILPKTLIGFVFELHYALLLDEDPDYWVVGIIGAFSVISVLTGLILWWPFTGKWLQAVTIKRKASIERLNFDLHKTFGFYSTVILIPVLFSGVYMNVPEHVVPVIECNLSLLV
ncbi:MAG: PepSY-associated TM helix domain-containing protein [Methyloglobulus sp.]